ncbi:MAG: DnaJ domain-containing protein [Thiohalocapsa sp.]
MGRLIILLVVVIGLLWFLSWFRKTPPHQVAAVLRKSLLWGGIGLLLLATLTGRLNPIFAAMAAAVPVLMRAANLLRMLPMIQQALSALGLGGLGAPASAGQGASGQTSAIRTRYLDVTLDHESGRMDGTVREGPFAGQLLSDLHLAQVLRMLELYQDSDAQSAAVLTAYLDREHGEDWRDAATADTGSASNSESRTGIAQGMSQADAWAVLGLEPGADADAIRDAHRRLMQKLHPDRGGSDYLAAQINAAKSLLLRE